MTFLEMIKSVELIAMRQPSIKTIIQSDIYRLNECPCVKYGVFSWMHDKDSVSNDETSTRYGLKLFYVDRLKGDGSNQVEIQSVGIQTIDNILRRLEISRMTILPYTFNTFCERFKDQCAGVMCDVAISVPNNLVCAYDFTGNN